MALADTTFGEMREELLAQFDERVAALRAELEGDAEVDVVTHTDAIRQTAIEVNELRGRTVEIAAARAVRSPPV